MYQRIRKLFKLFFSFFITHSESKVFAILPQIVFENLKNKITTFKREAHENP